MRHGYSMASVHYLLDSECLNCRGPHLQQIGVWVCFDETLKNLCVEQGEGKVSSIVKGTLLVQPLAGNDTVIVDAGLPHQVSPSVSWLCAYLQHPLRPLLVNIMRGQ